MAERLDRDGLERATKSLQEWQVERDGLTRVVRFPGGYTQVTAFVGRAMALAQQHDHHPDLGVHYDRVEIHLTTHDLGGASDADVALAEAFDRALAEIVRPDAQA